MANKTLTIKLTENQQKQIKEATGKDISELTLDLAATGNVTEKSPGQAGDRIFIHQPS